MSQLTCVKLELVTLLTKVFATPCSCGHRLNKAWPHLEWQRPVPRGYPTDTVQTTYIVCADSAPHSDIIFNRLALRRGSRPQKSDVKKGCFKVLKRAGSTKVADVFYWYV